MSPGIQDAIEGMEPYAEDPGSIGGSSVGLSSVSVRLVYYALNGSLKYIEKRLSSDGYFSFTKPSDFDMLHNFEFVLETVLPPPGKYKCQFAMTYSKARFYSDKVYANAVGLSGSITASLSQFSGDYTATANIDIGSLRVFRFILDVNNFTFPYGGYVSVKFTRLKSDAEVSGSTAGGATTPQEQVVDKVDSIGSQLAEGFDGIIGAVTGVGDKISGAMGQASDEITANADKNSQAQVEAMEENTNIITSALSSLGNFIIDGLKGLFIPSDDFFKTYFDDLYAWFEARLGFLMFPIDLIIQLADIFLGSSDVDCVLTLPSFSISGEQLWADQSFNLTDFLEEHFAFLLTAIRMVSSIGLVIMFVQLCERKWEEVMRN